MQSARALAAAIARGETTALAATEAALARIAETEPKIGAWTHLDAEGACRTAKALDARRGGGRPLGPLHGVPVGLKDIVDAEGMPCEFGTPLEAGRRPRADATVVRRLRAAGAVILGKTVTTEFAYFHPRGTRNPHDPERTPGGSSSGSAAAVAAGHVPLALGTQTNGSVIRPASFCGTFALKPSFGAIPRTGILPAAPSLDHVGLFAADVEDLALAEILMGPDGQDGGVSPAPLSPTALGAPPLAPNFALVETPWWDRAEETTKAAFAELREALGDHVGPVALPESFAGAPGHLRRIMAVEMAHGLGRYADRAPDQVSEPFATLMAEGRAIAATDYLAATVWATALRRALDEVFARYDAILTPATPGEAPGLETTGDPIYCSLWSLTGLPAVNLPLMSGPAGLPLGVQLVGPMGDDARLLRTARWLTRHLFETGETE